VLNTNTVAAVTPAVEVAVVADEDCPTTIAALVDGSTYTRLHFDSGLAVFTTGSTFPYPDDGTNIQYNQNPTSGTALTAITANARWVNIYGILVPVASDVASQAYRIVWMTGQASYNTLAAAQAEDFRSLSTGNLSSIFAEFVPWIRLTYTRVISNQTRNAQLNAIPAYLTGNKQSLVSVSGFVSPDHQSLTGRSDADAHPASAVSNTTYEGMTTTNVQSSLEYLYDAITYDTPANEFSYKNVPAARTIIIPAISQMRVYQQIQIDGILTIRGDLIVLER
jgi:hypothetical protein